MIVSYEQFSQKMTPFCNISLIVREKDNHQTEIFNDGFSPSHSRKYYKKECYFWKKLSIGDNYAVSIF